MFTTLVLIGLLLKSTAGGGDFDGSTFSSHRIKDSLGRTPGGQTVFRFEDQPTPDVKTSIKFEEERDDIIYHKNINLQKDAVRFEDDRNSAHDNRIRTNVDTNALVEESAVRKIKFDESRLEDVSLDDNDYDTQANPIRNNYIADDFDQNGLLNDIEKTKLTKFDNKNENTDSVDSDDVMERVTFREDGVSGNRELQKKRKNKRRSKHPTNLSPDTRYPAGLTGYGLIYPGTGYPAGIRGSGLTESPQYPGYPGGSAPDYPSYQSYPGGFPDPLNVGGSFNAPLLGNAGVYPGNQGYYGPSRRPKSLASRAVTAVVEALTSIALYDDYQCVPRLLCEAAGGRATGSSALVTAASGLQPLLTKLSAYNGASYSPLFVFGRAVILGATSKGNTGSCRYAYPQCPTDPEQLIYYLNNHNGGFFRFFNSPHNSHQAQNLEQFYNQLAGQYGLLQANGNLQGLGLQNQFNYDQQNQNLYGNSQNYGSNYAYGQKGYGLQDGYKNRSKSDNIQDRIQNKPNSQDLEDISAEEQEPNSKWLFPDQKDYLFMKITKKREREPERRGSKTLKFPDESIQSIFDYSSHVRKDKSVLFPDKYYNGYIQNNHLYDTTTTNVNLSDYEFDHKYNFYVKKRTSSNNYKHPNKYVRDDDNGFRTVYIVRGNGDPNHPEILKIKAGQSFL